MDQRRIVLPNDANGFIADELRERLSQGLTVRIAFGGTSMLPMIEGRNDKVELEPMSGKLRVGEIYLFVYQGHFVIHRLMKIKEGLLTFRGDNCLNEEVVESDAVMARLKSVEHADGTRTSCSSPEWKRRSRRVLARRMMLNLPFKVFGRRHRRWERWVYLALLLVLMWTPVGGLGIKLDSRVLNIRLDHLLHASVYIPFVFFIMDFGKKQSRLLVPHWLSGLLFAAVTETGQLLLFYRGFDPSDLVANFLGVTLGWMLVVLWNSKRRIIRRVF